VWGGVGGGGGWGGGVGTNVKVESNKEREGNGSGKSGLHQNRLSHWEKIKEAGRPRKAQGGREEGLSEKGKPIRISMSSATSPLRNGCDPVEKKGRGLGMRRGWPKSATINELQKNTQKIRAAPMGEKPRGEPRRQKRGRGGRRGGAAAG